MCFAVGDFERVDDGEHEGLPVAYFSGKDFSKADLKRSFGRNTIILDYEGEGDFLKDDLLNGQKQFANYSELRLKEGVDAQEVLRRAVAAGIRINRFELVEPSLNEIFIATVRKANGKRGGV